jgi:hypothetical protein
MGPAAVVSSVFAKLEEIVYVVVPRLEVGATGASALAALVNGDELVIVQLEKWDDTLRLAISPFDKATGAADGCPGTT